MYCIDAARVVTGSKLVVQLQKSDADPVKYQYEELHITSYHKEKFGYYSQGNAESANLK